MLSFFARSNAFQKNLVVWKPPKEEDIWSIFNEFQKNLVVWKQRCYKRKNQIKFKVSEELSSVETGIGIYDQESKILCFRRT